VLRAARNEAKVSPRVYRPARNRVELLRLKDLLNDRQSTRVNEELGGVMSHFDAWPIVRAAIPGASDSLIGHVIWGRTAYPFKQVTPRELYRAASRLRRAEANGIQLCDWCDNKAVENICESCSKALRAALGETDG
jgi:hypothetical protein